MGAGDSIALLSLSENPGAWTSWLSSFHPTSPTLAASLADGASLSPLQRVGERIHGFIKCRITGNCVPILLLSLTPQPENKTKQKAGKNRKRILSWASMIWMLYYQLLSEPQLSRSPGFKLPHILPFILKEENPWVPSQVGLSKRRKLVLGLRRVEAPRTQMVGISLGASE